MIRLLTLLFAVLSWAVPHGAAAEASARVDCSTLTGKVMCGYQGWFNAPGDGRGLGFRHWSRKSRELTPESIRVDMWPDVSELDPDERFETGFRHADGRPAEVFSSANRKTVVRHFRWMQEYGIDGAFLQRFAVSQRRPDLVEHQDTVLSNVRVGAKEHGRAYAMMYDLSGLRRGEIVKITRDWARLHRQDKITADANYMRHNGKPLVAVWGIGFGDGRDYTLEECWKFVQWLKRQGCSVMIGAPTYWREGRRDSVDHPLLKRILSQADVLSPWTVGRYSTPEQAQKHAQEVWAPDLAWCQDQKIDFLPVVFAGFSWHNMHRQEDPLNQTPRLGGQFLWSQMVSAKRVGCSMIYVAMFDEVDEATAIFKVTNQPPVNSGFVTYEGLPSDHYLKLVGEGARMLRGERAVTDQVPVLDRGAVLN